MKRKLIHNRYAVFVLCVLVAMLAPPLFAGATNWNIQGRPTSDWFSGNNTTRDVPHMWMKEADRLLSISVGIGNANIWYVDSNQGTAVTEDGQTWNSAFDTVDEAINQCSVDDFIMVRQTHAESGTVANLWDADVEGITIYHLGNGANQGTYTLASIYTTIAFGAPNITVYGGRFIAGVSEVITGLIFEGAADDCALIGAVFPESTVSTYEFDKAIWVSGGADRNTFAYCTAYSADLAGATNWLDLDQGVQNGTQIIGNQIYGNYSEGPIHSDDVDLDVHVWGNVISNLATGQHGIEFTAAALGTYGNNWVYTDSEITSIDPGSLKAVAPNWVVNGINSSPVMFPASTQGGLSVSNWNFTDDGGGPGEDTLYTVTGDIRGTLYGVCDVAVTSTSSASISVGANDNLALIIASTPGALLVAHEIWHDATPTASIEKVDLTGSNDFVLTNGQDIVFALGSINAGIGVSAGDIDFYLWWSPLSVGATVVAN